MSISITIANKSAIKPAIVITIKLISLILVCSFVIRSRISDNKFNITAINGSIITIAANTMMRNDEDEFWANFSNHVSGRKGILNCCSNLLTKNKNGIISITREAEVNFLAVADKDFIL